MYISNLYEASAYMKQLASKNSKDLCRIVDELSFKLVPICQQFFKHNESNNRLLTGSPKSPDIPTSILQSQYMELNLQLIATINSDPNTSSNRFKSNNDPSEINLPRPKQLNKEISLRGKISKILHQIQLAADVTSISSFRPIAVAFQLCLIEQGLLRKIHQNDLLIHKPPHSPAPSLLASAEFFNYFTRIVECSVLDPVLPADRAKTIIRWIKVARKLRKFNNFQSLKAVICALNTPPISRLKRTWSIVKRKPEFTDLLEFRNLLSEESNYSAYREWLKVSLTRPLIPFIGVLIHDTTYILTVAKREGIDPHTDRRIQDIQKHLRYCTSGPRYSYEVLSAVDAACQATKKGLQFRRKMSGGLSEQGQEELPTLKDFESEEIGDFINHWILSRPWITEKEVDELSLIREPRISNIHSTTPAPNRSVVRVETIESPSYRDDRLNHNHASSTSPQVSAQDVCVMSENGDDEVYQTAPTEFSLNPDESPSGEIIGNSALLVPQAPPPPPLPPRTLPKSSLGPPISGLKSSALAAYPMSPGNGRKKASGSSSLIEAIKGTAYSMVQSNKPRTSGPVTALTRRLSGKSLSATDVKDYSIDGNDVSSGDGETLGLEKLNKETKDMLSDDWSLNSLKSLSMEHSLEQNIDRSHPSNISCEDSASLLPQPSESLDQSHASMKRVTEDNVSSKAPSTSSSTLSTTTSANSGRRSSFFSFSNVFTSTPSDKDRIKRDRYHKKSMSCDVPDLDIDDATDADSNHFESSPHLRVTKLKGSRPTHSAEPSGSSSPSGLKPVPDSLVIVGPLTSPISGEVSAVKTSWGTYSPFRKQLSEANTSKLVDSGGRNSQSLERQTSKGVIVILDGESGETGRQGLKQGKGVLDEVVLMDGKRPALPVKPVKSLPES
ncbi:hypothetical protein HDU67_009179 [Dinochytrium kinnereticum]|nr:hypothetical protein HDU67_009179 [Dinochytrium kinnereticum]